MQVIEREQLELLRTIGSDHVETLAALELAPKKPFSLSGPLIEKLFAIMDPSQPTGKPLTPRDTNILLSDYYSILSNCKINCTYSLQRMSQYRRLLQNRLWLSVRKWRRWLTYIIASSLEFFLNIYWNWIYHDFRVTP